MKLTIFRKIFNSAIIHKYIPELKQKIYYRSNSTDLEVLKATIQKYHRPPLDLLYHNQVNQLTILDLGSNIGTTIIDLKNLYPNSLIIGVELNLENYNMLCRNTKNIPNLQLFNNAIWSNDIEVEYEGENHQSFKVSTDSSHDYHNKNKIQGITINSIVKQLNIKRIDYLKMDIEGAEIEVFTNSKIDWLDITSCINVEIHDKIYFETIFEILEKKQFFCFKDSRHWSSIIGIKII